MPFSPCEQFTIWQSGIDSPYPLWTLHAIGFFTSPTYYGRRDGDDWGFQNIKLLSSCKHETILCHPLCAARLPDDICQDILYLAPHSHLIAVPKLIIVSSLSKVEQFSQHFGNHKSKWTFVLWAIKKIFLWKQSHMLSEFILHPKLELWLRKFDGLIYFGLPNFCKFPSARADSSQQETLTISYLHF